LERIVSERRGDRGGLKEGEEVRRRGGEEGRGGEGRRMGGGEGKGGEEGRGEVG